MDAKQTIQEKLLQTLKDMILGPLKMHQEAVDKFKKKINEDGNVLHTLEWNTSSTMKKRKSPKMSLLSKNGKIFNLWLTKI